MLRSFGTTKVLRRLGTLAVPVLAALAMVASVTPPASALEVYPRPENGTIQLSGHGYGHGRGMSQWGAYGAATSGLTYGQILAFYYTGVTLVTEAADPGMLVWISADNDNNTRVAPAAGLRVVTDQGSTTLPTSVGGTTVTGWRAIRLTAGNVWQLQSTTNGSTWTTYAPITNAGDDVEFFTTSGVVRVVLPSGTRDIRGSVRAVKYDRNGVIAARTVGVLTMTNYLRSVVPAEMPAGWHTEALKAQAVAARTYAARLREAAPASQPWDVCDTVSCQVFSGTSTENSRTDAAVTATARRYLKYNNALILTEFSASNGGWTVSGGSTYPYMTAKADPYDGVVPNYGSMVNTHSWTTSVPASTLENAYPTIGRLTAVQVAARNGNGEWGGRVTSVRLVGSNGTETISGSIFRQRTGIRSEWWIPRYSGQWDDFTGDGRLDVFARARTGHLHRFAGTGTGLAAPVAIGGGWGAMSSVHSPGDMDGDGLADLYAVVRATGDLLLYPGNGSGWVNAGRTVGVGWNVFTQIVAPGDWSGDGLPDILAVDQQGRLRLYRGTGTGGVLPYTVVGRGWQVFDALAGVGDIDGDGRAELVARESASPGRLRIYNANGSGGFDATTVFGSGWQIMSMLSGAGDVDGDGRPDLLAVVRSSGALMLYRGTGGSTFAAAQQIGGGWKAYDEMT